MPRFEVNGEDLEFQAYCERCGHGLCANVETYERHYNDGDTERWIEIEPCERCLDEARKQVRWEGGNDG